MIDQNVAEPPEVGILEPREHGLAGEVGTVGEAVGGQLEDRIGPERVVVVLVFVIGEDPVDPLADHAQERLLDEDRMAAIVESGDELLNEPERLIELPHRRKPRVVGQGGRRNLDFHRPGRQAID